MKLLPMNIETMTMPVISTGHLSESDSVRLNAHNYHSAMMFTGEYGWILYVTEHDPENNFESVERIMEWAREHSYEWVRLDCDADAVAGLPTYDW